MKRYLILENGSVYPGESFGVTDDICTEIVFSTGMTGYQEGITDPSYYGQGMVFTYPLIGNYGITRDDNESFQPAVDAVIVHELAQHPNNYRMVMTLEEYAREENLVGLTGVDTRALTKEIREVGSLMGVIVSDNSPEHVTRVFEKGAANKATPLSQPFESNGGSIKIALIDFGVKNSIIRALNKRGASVVVFPATTSAKEIEQIHPDGIVLSNGSGDPSQADYALPLIQTLQQQFPLMGICFGHQLFARANGATTYKMKFGHRGFNHAVANKNGGPNLFTSQNHGYAVSADSVENTDLMVTHTEINDKVVEGLAHKNFPAFSVQFHPDACPGPHDAEFLFDTFLKSCQKGAQ